MPCHNIIGDVITLHQYLFVHTHTGESEMVYYLMCFFFFLFPFWQMSYGNNSSL